MQNQTSYERTKLQMIEKEKCDSLNANTDKPWEKGIEPTRILFANDSKEIAYFPNPKDPSCCIRITPENPVYVYSYNGFDYYVPSDLVKK